MHKFLAQGARGPVSGFAWPSPSDGAPGAWVEAAGALVPCARGVHVCRPCDLAHWIHDELWEVEVQGEPLDALDCIVVARARLVKRIDAWDGPGGERFAGACVDHASSAAGPATDATRELLEDARYMVTHGYVALAAFTAAVAVGRTVGGASPEQAYRHERVWQGEWIVRELTRARS